MHLPPQLCDELDFVLSVPYHLGMKKITRQLGSIIHNRRLQSHNTFVSTDQCDEIQEEIKAMGSAFVLYQTQLT